MNQGRATVPGDGEKEIASALAEIFVEEGSGKQGERWPFQLVDDGWGKVGLEQVNGVFVLGEGRFEEAIVRVVQGGLWHVLLRSGIRGRWAGDG